MYKNIAIFGPSRSGKSTLAAMICKQFDNYHAFGGDEVRDAFMEVFPESGIDNHGGSGMHGDFQNFLYKMLHHHIRKNHDSIKYVVETCDMTPAMAKEIFGKRKDIIILFLGYPNISTKEKFEQLREYETECDWTYGQTDEHMLNHTQDNIELSKKWERECAELGLQFIDTSRDRDRVLDEVMTDLKKKMRGRKPKNYNQSIRTDVWD